MRLQSHFNKDALEIHLPILIGLLLAKIIVTAGLTPTTDLDREKCLSKGNTSKLQWSRHRGSNLGPRDLITNVLSTTQTATYYCGFINICGALIFVDFVDGLTNEIKCQ